jgi:hypothetical protein
MVALFAGVRFDGSAAFNAQCYRVAASGGVRGRVLPSPSAVAMSEFANWNAPSSGRAADRRDP